MTTNKRLMKTASLISLVALSVILLSCMLRVYIFPLATSEKEEVKYIEATIQEQPHTLMLKQHHIYTEGEEPLTDEKILDAVCYDFEKEGTDELILLTLGEEDKTLNRSFGKVLQVYNLSDDEGSLKAELISETNLGSVHPFMIKAGRLDQSEKYGNIFVGVYKDTLYYHDVINRPFFFSWNGEFIERKWTGSFLSNYEMMDLAFGDLVGDGVDEIAVLEKVSDDSYRVALYKWLGFGFDYLVASKKEYKDAKSIKIKAEEGKNTVWIDYRTGKEEKVGF